MHVGDVAAGTVPQVDRQEAQRKEMAKRLMESDPRFRAAVGYLDKNNGKPVTPEMRDAYAYIQQRIGQEVGQ